MGREEVSGVVARIVSDPAAGGNSPAGLEAGGLLDWGELSGAPAGEKGSGIVEGMG
jgi:hypothetical protein